MYLEPTKDQLDDLIARAASPEPVFMINLLRFKDLADPVPGVPAGLSGLELYLKYAAATESHLGRVGGVIVWAGACNPAVIGPDEPEWDSAAIVRYPSRAAFLEMIGDADYLPLAAWRSAALRDSRLIPSDLLSFG